MIILDTNVISELMREEPASTVNEWIQSFDANQIALTAITVAEFMRGLLRLPEGKRRHKLTQNFNEFINNAFPGRIWPFDEQAAFLYAEISTYREQEGLAVDPVDLIDRCNCQISQSLGSHAKYKRFRVLWNKPY